MVGVYFVRVYFSLIVEFISSVCSFEVGLFYFRCCMPLMFWMMFQLVSCVLFLKMFLLK